MSNKTSTCQYIDRGVLEAAKRARLNLSRVSENALEASIHWIFEHIDVCVDLSVYSKRLNFAEYQQHECPGCMKCS